MENQVTKTKTFEEYLKEYSDNPELDKKIFDAGGEDWEDIKEYPYDYCDPSTGSVSGMIYYRDTEPFAKENIEEILDMVANFDYETGSSTLALLSDGNILNGLAWFAWENLMSNIIRYLEEE